MFQARRIKILLITSLLALAVVSVGLFFWGKQLDLKPKRALSLLPTNVDMHLRGVNYTEVKEGRDEWTLKADAMRYSKFNQLLHFDQVEIVLLNASQGRILVSGEKAKYDRKAKMVKLIGHVLIHNIEGYRLTANELIYKVDTKLLLVPGRFKIMGPKLTLDGRDLTLDVDSRRLQIGREARALFDST
ncbi:MAG: LPS export ABC transporter periplasmic protein LptC [Deltaproteobacteria bacterium]|nr:LPS export ABC transporter periplasmic protein LptC [Deltaproteobacteria bacterium]